MAGPRVYNSELATIEDGPDVGPIWDEVSQDEETEDSAIEIMDDPSTTETDKLMNLDALAENAATGTYDEEMNDEAAETKFSDMEDADAAYGQDAVSEALSATAFNTATEADARGQLSSDPEAAAPREKRVYGQVTKGEQVYEGPPSLKNYLNWTTDQALNNASMASAFPEDSDPNLTQALKQKDPIAEKLSGLGKMDAQMRSKTGAAVGGLFGSQFMGGEEGAIIGGSIGSAIARGAGMAQSGEQAKINRDNRIWNSMKSIGAVAPDGKVSFEDGDVSMPSEATGRLKNLRINPLNGNRDRSLYELDDTNPLTQKSVLVSKPIAMYLAQGMLGYRNKDNPVDADAPKSATAMLANTLSDGAADEQTVYSRAQQMVEKMGLKEANVRSYFSSISKDVSIEEAEGIKRAMNILFAENRTKASPRRLEFKKRLGEVREAVQKEKEFEESMRLPPSD